MPRQRRQRREAHVPALSGRMRDSLPAASFGAQMAQAREERGSRTGEEHALDVSRFAQNDCARAIILRCIFATTCCAGRYCDVRDSHKESSPILQVARYVRCLVSGEAERKRKSLARLVHSACVHPATHSREPSQSLPRRPATPLFDIS